MFYPGYGSRGEPHGGWYHKYKESSWDTIEHLGKYYQIACRYLRRLYKWSPQVLDDIYLSRFIRIFDEAIEDNEKNDLDEDDL